MKKIPIGISDFRELRREDFYFADKSLFIRDVIQDNAKVILLPRPRRFGKTLNLSMLRYFFEKTDDPKQTKELFAGLAVEKQPQFEEHIAKYPVIFLSFKDVSGLNFEESFEFIKDAIAEEFERHSYLLDSRMSDSKKREFENILTKNERDFAYKKSLKTLSKYLYEYHNQKVIILIDEYDTPIHTAYYKGYYEECAGFFRTFLGGGLKDNPHIFKSVLTGILRIAKESIFSGLNNLGVYSLLSYKFSDKFGLTQTEVENILTDYNCKNQIEKVEKWYNGYIFGDTMIYNPWSILSYISNIRDGFRTHWINTSSNDLVKDIIKKSPYTVKNEIQHLLQDIPITKVLDENIAFDNLYKNENALYSFLAFTGYLKAFDARSGAKEEDDINYKLLIPNIEVKSIFKKVISEWIEESYEKYKLNQMFDALTRCDIDIFEEYLSNFVLETLSYFDTAKGRDVERVYQAFILGMFVNLPYYEVYSNKESGLGGYDISLIPTDKSQKAFILELKTIKKDETKDSALEAALKQIEDKKYEADIKKRGIKDIEKLAVVFDGKKAWVKGT